MSIAPNVWVSKTSEFLITLFALFVRESVPDWESVPEVDVTEKTVEFATVTAKEALSSDVPWSASAKSIVTFCDVPEKLCPLGIVAVIVEPVLT